MQRIGIAGFLHETNTFSNTPTPLENFLNQSGFYPELLAGKEMLRFSEGKINIAASGFMADAETYGFTIVPLVWIGTEPSQPKGFDLAPDIIKQCETYAEDVGGSFKITNDFAEGFKGAHAVYPKAWAPFTLFQPPVGEYDFEKSQKIQDSFKSWKATSELMDTCDKKPFTCTACRRTAVMRLITM